MAAEPEEEKESAQRASSQPFRPVLLWLIVTALWTSATLYRVGWLLLPVDAERDPANEGLAWIFLLLPPAMFAVLLWAVSVSRSRR